MKREQKKNIEKLEKVIEEKKKIPKEIKKKINSKILKNLAIILGIALYFTGLYFGMINIPTDIYIVILKVISIIFLVATIIILEIGYRKDNEEVWLHGIEAMAVGVFTQYLISLYSIFYARYGTLILSAGIVVLVYYAIKIIIIKRRIEKEYIKSLTDIGEIVKK